jgi:uncharacterized protein HemX
MAAKKKNTPRKTGGKKNSSLMLPFVLVLSLGALGASLWLLHQERQKNSDRDSVTEKALKMAEAHPDAEVFQVEDLPAPATEKKK